MKIYDKEIDYVDYGITMQQMLVRLTDKFIQKYGKGKLDIKLSLYEIEKCLEEAYDDYCKQIEENN